MTQELDAIDFIGDLSKSTGVNIAVGMNAFLEQPDQTNQFKLLIDPSSLSGEDEAKIERYAESRRLSIHDCWSDWGRFLRVSKPKTAS
jgi:hypothetical protein